MIENHQDCVLAAESCGESHSNRVRSKLYTLFQRLSLKNIKVILFWRLFKAFTAEVCSGKYSVSVNKYMCFVLSNTRSSFEGFEVIYPVSLIEILLLIQYCFSIEQRSKARSFLHFLKYTYFLEETKVKIR